MNSNFTIAVHSLVYLASMPGYMASSESIAHNVATSSARIRKVMSALRNNGYVKTKEGTRGGYILGKSPECITLGHVYEAIAKGALQPSWQTGDPKHQCPIASNTQNVMDCIFEEAEESYASFLNQFTVAAVLQQIQTNK